MNGKEFMFLVLAVVAGTYLYTIVGKYLPTL